MTAYKLIYLDESQVPVCVCERGGGGGGRGEHFTQKSGL